MGRYQFFMPPRKKINHAAIVALPGIVTEDEPTRINHILKKLTKYGIIGVRINYARKNKEGDCTEYSFSIEESQSYLENIIRVLPNTGTDRNRIGIISNSTSAIPVTRFLMKNKARCYASISPILGWNYFADRRTRERIEKKEKKNSKKKKKKKEKKKN